MKKLILSILLLASVVLSACAKSTTTPTSEPTAPAAPSAAAPVPTTELVVPGSSSLSEPQSGCTVMSKQPTPGPTETSLFMPITKDDHVKGPDTAKITLIEYSDFQ